MTVSVLWNTEELERLFDGYTYTFNELCWAEDGDIVAVDPGDPSGVVLVHPPIRKMQIAEISADSIDWHLSYRSWSDVELAPYRVICETPLYGAVRVFDPAPWKVRGYLELTYGVIGIPVSALKLGKKLVTIKGVASPHARDALRYLAVAVSTNEDLRKELSQ